MKTLGMFAKIAMHSASQVDQATEFCFLDGELIAGPNSDEEKQFIQ